MRVYRTTRGIVIQVKGQFYLSKHTDWDDFVSRHDLFFSIAREIQSLQSDPSYWDYVRHFPLPPIGRQEIWHVSPTPSLLSTASRCCLQDKPLRVYSTAQSRAGIAILFNSQAQIQGISLIHLVSSSSTFPYQDNIAIGPCLWVLEPDAPMTWEIMSQLIRDNAVVTTLKKEIEWNLPEHFPTFWEQQHFPEGMYLALSLVTCPDLLSGDRLKTSLAALGSLQNSITT